MGAAVVHFEINVRDSKRAQDFYGTLFDWTVDLNNPINYGLVNTGLAMGIGGGIGETAEGAVPFATFYVQVEDVKGYLDKAVRLGGRVIVPETVIPNMVTLGQFADPEGNIIGLVEGPQTAPPPKKKAARKPAKNKAPARKKRSNPKRKTKKRFRR
jgi:predicted enzyme related to lactoylglutathione lyase